MLATELESQLQGLLGGSFERISVLEEIDSSNAEAMRRMAASQECSQLIVALSQSAGRGRRGRKWLSPAGAGLYISITRSFTRPLSELAALSLVTALSVQEATASLGANSIQLKWPNDLLCNDKKLAGILLESCQNSGQAVIVFGIGINLALPDSVQTELERPVTDLKSVLGSDVDAAQFLRNLSESLDNNLARFEESGFSSFQLQWNALDRYIGERVSVDQGGNRIEGKAIGVDEEGALLIESTTGTTAIAGGEVIPSMRIADDAE